MSQEQIQQIEMDIETAKQNVAMGDALERLHNNKDFQTIICEQFLREEAVRLVSLKAAPSQQGEDQQKAILKQIDGIGALRLFFNKIYSFANSSAEAIEASQAALAEIDAEMKEEEAAANG